MFCPGKNNSEKRGESSPSQGKNGRASIGKGPAWTRGGENLHKL